jgi:hypothetical protein
MSNDKWKMISSFTDAVGALELKLDESEMKALADPYQPHHVFGF